MGRCGKPQCRCANGGPKHGPYYYRYYQDKGRQRKVYVPLGQVDRVREATRHWKELHPPAYRLEASLRELESLLKFLTQEVHVGQ